jgi:hypothetical protein
LELNAYRDAARLLGIVLVEQPLRTEREAETTLAEIKPLRSITSSRRDAVP